MKIYPDHQHTSELEIIKYDFTNWARSYVITANVTFGIGKTRDKEGGALYNDPIQSFTVIERNNLTET